MSLPADKAPTSDIPARIVAAWNGVGTRWNPVAVIAAAWAVLAGPLVFFRGFNSDEGLAVTIARSALEDGYWLTPHVFNVRFVERPTLLSWIIAAVSAPFGGVGQVTARLPIALFLLLGCLLIYALLRKAAAGVPAALLGVALFLACPLVMRSYVMITADMPLAVLLFLAFVLWWNGFAEGAIGYGRWVAVGVVLALAGLMKGPQPVGYFALGIGLFVLGSRSWRQIPGFALAGLIGAAPLAAWYGFVYRSGDQGQWAAFMRLRPAVVLSGPIETAFGLLIQTLPATLLAATFLIARGFRGGAVRPAFCAALTCYAFTASLFVLFWPGGATARYFYPMVLPLCVFGGLGYDALVVRRPEIVAPLLAPPAALLLYALGYAAASPLLPTQFRQARLDAARMTALVQAAPAPIYRTGDAALNVLPYVPGRIRSASLKELAAVPGPAWMVLPGDQAETLQSRRPDRLRAVTTLGRGGEWRLLHLDD